ncbi:hypothetical protein, partial [Roseicyclus sp.]|uniref:hypothetical protein n=1 Tax=Roseicyclus sp. TaxID=1914329 RepID=UPI001BCF04E9
EENHDIAYAVRDIVEISEHINDRSIRSPSVNREIKELGASCDDAIQRINQAKSVDDEIPL